MNQTTINPLFGKLFRDRNTQFLFLQIVGWFSLSLISFFSLTLWYNQQSVAYIAHTLLQSVMGVAVSWPLRSVFHYLWNKPLFLRLLLTMVSVLVCSLIWSALRIGAFLWMTNETDVWSDFGGWLFGSIMIFLCWAAFYHGIKYYQLLQSEHEALLKFAAENKEEQLKRSRAETIAQEAQLKMLRYQLNPHFLFNTLNAISALVVGRSTANANTMIMQLSNFLRYSLENDPIKRVTLEQEVGALKLYLDIEKTRFADRLEVEFDVDAAAHDVKIPSLLLQPLVENAIKYAIAPAEKGGKISIFAKLDGDHLIIEVADTGPGIQDGKNAMVSGPGIGLKNTVDRLSAFYGDNYIFELRGPQSGGMTIYIRLPLEKQTAESNAELGLGR
jgi:two-component system LytT family sensor kinase|tara:strand:+ start:2574 stop:3734 length:1161 start_codon:yes stop_codon:yes gene_type:complete